MVSALDQLMAWYHAQCDGDWEHEYGLVVESMDNPGWSVRIDLAYTGVEPARIKLIDEHRSEQDWLRCAVDPAVCSHLTERVITSSLTMVGRTTSRRSSSTFFGVSRESG